MNIEKNDIIIVINTPGQPKMFFDRYHNFINDRKVVNGWKRDEFDIAKVRVTELQNHLHYKVKVSLDIR